MKMKVRTVNKHIYTEYHVVNSTKGKTEKRSKNVMNYRTAGCE